MHSPHLDWDCLAVSDYCQDPLLTASAQHVSDSIAKCVAHVGAGRNGDWTRAS